MKPVSDFFSGIADLMKSSPLACLLWLAGLVLCLVASLLLMPAAELMPAQANVPSAVASLSPGLSPIRSDEVMQAYKGIAESFAQIKGWSGNLSELSNSPFEENAPGELRAYVLYAIGLSAALIAAAISITAVGRFDAEEKTVIPVKK